MKFKVGDIIVDNEKANKYGFTRKGTIARVISIYPHIGKYDMQAEIIKFPPGIYQPVPMEFPLESFAFDLMNPRKTRNLPAWW